MRLPAGASNNHVGTHLGSMCEVPGVPDPENEGEFLEPGPAAFLDCQVAQDSFFSSKEARANVENSTLSASRKGKIVVDLFGGDLFNPATDVMKGPTGLPLCELFAADSLNGGLAIHSVARDSDGDGIRDSLRMQFNNRDPNGVNPQVGDDYVRLECQAEITVSGGTGVLQTIITGDEVVVIH